MQSSAGFQKSIDLIFAKMQRRAYSKEETNVYQFFGTLSTVSLLKIKV